MDVCANTPYDYQVGGSLRIGAPSYIHRQADEVLFQALLSREYCYIFNARQMGKSSLRVRMQQQLVEQGKLYASIDMTGIGSEQVTPTQWYKGLMVDLLSKFELRDRINFGQWWQAQESVPLVQRLRLFLEEILLQNLPDRDLYIFVDEIDSALALDFPIDDFFALVRFCYNQRAENEAYQRLTWVLMGVVSPSDLIRDPVRTPFNVGWPIQLKGLQFEDAKALARGLAGYGYEATALLQAILAWTGGQPFLTQKLCRLSEQVLRGQLALRPSRAEVFHDQPVPTHNSVPPEGSPENLPENLPESSPGDLPATPDSLIALIVYHHIQEHWESQDNPEHLRTIRDRLLSNELRAPRLLGIYETILTCEEPLWADGVLSPEEVPLLLAYDDSPEHIELLLSGLIENDQGRLRVKNRLYRTIFNSQWVKQQLDGLRPYPRQLAAWIASNYTDESRLLRGKALKDAQAWSQERSVSEVDHEFLMASVQYDRQITQQALKSARLREVEKRLAIEHRSRQRQRVWIVTLSGTLLGVALLAVLARVQFQKARFAALAAMITTSQAELASDQHLSALVSAIRANRAFEHLGDSASKGALGGLRTEALVALRQAAVSGVERNRLILKESNFWDVTLSPDGQYLLTTSEDFALRLWRPDGQWVRTFLGHQARVRTARFFPKGDRIVSGADDGEIKIWDIQGRLRNTLRGHLDIVYQVAVSPDGQIVASASGDRTVKLWQPNGRLLHTLRSHTDEVLAVAFSPDGQTLASAGNDRTIKLWNRQGKLLRTFKPSAATIAALAFSPDGQQLVSGHRDATLTFWQLNGTPIRSQQAHQGDIQALAFSPNGERLLSGSRDQSLKLWTAEGKLLQTLSGHTSRVNAVDFAPSGQQVVSAASDQTVRWWDLTNPLLTHYAGSRSGLIDVDVSPDGQLIAAASDDYHLYIWNRKSGQLLHRLEHPEAVLSVAFSPDGRWLATGCWDGKTRLWTSKGELFARLEGQSKSVWDVAISPEGNRLATASVDGKVRLWNLDGALKVLSQLSQQEMARVRTRSQAQSTLQPYRQVDANASLLGHRSEVRSVDFSADGQYLLSASLDRTVKLWTAEGKPIRTFYGDSPQSSFIDARFSPDSQRIAAGGFDNKVRIWRVEGSLVRILQGHEAEVRSVSFNRDGQQILTAGGDGKVILWDAQGLPVETLVVDEQAVWQALFTETVRPVAHNKAANNNTKGKPAAHRPLLNSRLTAKARGYRDIRENDDPSENTGENTRELPSVVAAGENKQVVLWQLADVTSQAALLTTGCQWAQNYIAHSPEITDKDICKGL